MTTFAKQREHQVEAIRHLAIHLHDNFCNDGEECEWKLEEWVNLNSQSPHKADFYDKAEKIYNYFDFDFKMAKKFVEFIEINPKAARMLVQSL